MNTLTPKGKRILVVLGAVAVLIAGWQLFGLVRDTSSPSQPEEFNETPHTSFADSIQKLPQETDHYRIEFDDARNILLIVPKITIDGDANPTEELARQWPTYEQYANEAVEWMRQQKFEFQSFEIEFWMEDFWPEGKRISY